MAKAIVEMVHLMYQNQTAASFYRGLSSEIQTEMERRHLTANPEDAEPCPGFDCETRLRPFTLHDPRCPKCR